MGPAPHPLEMAPHLAGTWPVLTPHVLQTDLWRRDGGGFQRPWRSRGHRRSKGTRDGKMGDRRKPAERKRTLKGTTGEGAWRGGLPRVGVPTEKALSCQRAKRGGPARPAVNQTPTLRAPRQPTMALGDQDGRLAASIRGSHQVV